MKKIFYIQNMFWQQDAKEKMPDVSFIPALLRRRLTGVEKIGLFLAHQWEPLPEDCRIIFASRFGEWQQTIDLIHQFFRDREMSPAGFSHSVHNAMPGLLSILSKNKASYTSIAAQSETIESGLVEAFCAPSPVLLIYAEEETPEFYRSKFSDPFLGHGFSLVVSEQELPGAQKILVEIKNQEQSALTFQELYRFFQKGDLLSTRYLTLRKTE